MTDWTFKRDRESSVEDTVVAHFAPYKHYPILFHGPTEEVGREAVEQFRAGVKNLIIDDMDDLLA